MTNFRFKALEVSLSRQRKQLNLPKEKVSSYFGELTFNRDAMREFLTQEAFQKLQNVIEKGETIAGDATSYDTP